MENLPFAMIWRNLEGIVLSEQAGQRKINTGWYHVCVEPKNRTKQKPISQKQKRTVVARGWGKAERSDTGQRPSIFSYKETRVYGCNVEHSGCSQGHGTVYLKLLRMDTKHCHSHTKR